MMKPERRGAKPLAAFLPGVIEATLAARGLSEASLIADWPAIVGETIARYARPIQLQWPPRPPRRDPEATVAPATLVLRVDGAFALEAQHGAGIIVARVNAHLGWRCVEKIAFRQGPLPPRKEKRREPPAPSAESQAAASWAASSIEDAGLREALAQLGARAIDKSTRMREGEE
jgi:hypothetical protein